MTIISFKETFIKYQTPFLTVIKALISNASGVVDSVDATRPMSVNAGEYWDNNSGDRFYFDGTNDIPAGKTRPTGLIDGDKWVDTSVVPVQKKIVNGANDDIDYAISQNIEEDPADNITDAEALAFYTNA